jgi:hypothetical protein
MMHGGLRKIDRKSPAPVCTFAPTSPTPPQGRDRQHSPEAVRPREPPRKGGESAEKPGPLWRRMIEEVDGGRRFPLARPQPPRPVRRLSFLPTARSDKATRRRPRKRREDEAWRFGNSSCSCSCRRTPSTPSAEAMPRRAQPTRPLRRRPLRRSWACSTTRRNAAATAPDRAGGLTRAAVRSTTRRRRPTPPSRALQQRSSPVGSSDRTPLLRLLPGFLHHPSPPPRHRRRRSRKPGSRSSPRSRRGSTTAARCPDRPTAPSSPGDIPGRGPPPRPPC